MQHEEGHGLHGLTNDPYYDRSTILSEDVTRKISKSLTVLVSKAGHHSNDDGSINYLDKSLEALLRTASSSQLSPPHSAATLGALSGLLDQCSISASSQVQDIAFKAETWTRAFQILLEKSINNKPKPIRRLLVTLTLLLNRQPNKNVCAFLAKEASTRSITAIIDQEEAASVKIAIQVLEHLLTQNIISASLILEIFSCGSDSNLTNKGVALKKNSTATAQSFILRVLEWLEYPDCVPAISRFLPVFTTKFSEYQSAENVIMRDGGIRCTSPVWIEAVKLYLEKHPSNLEVLENHVLPNLLRGSESDHKVFLDTLPLEEIRQGSSGSCSEADLVLCLLTARVGINSRLCDMDNAARKALEENTMSSNLLNHASSSVRNAALLVLTAPPTMHKPLTDETLARLKNTLPNYHQETNPKSRNEFIAASRKLCRRIRSSVKAFPRSYTTPAPSSQGETSSLHKWSAPKHNGDNLGQPLELLSWYADFLVKELRPTASYQSHITALSVLHDLLDTDSIFFETLITVGSRQASIGRQGPTRLPSRCFIDLLFDPFEDVRQVSAVILRSLLHRGLDSQNNANEHVGFEGTRIRIEHTHDVVASIIRCIQLARDLFRRSGRADHADGFGRLLALAYSAGRSSNARCEYSSTLDTLQSELQDDVYKAVDDLDYAIRCAPVHGHLIALRYIIGLPESQKIFEFSEPRAALAFSSKMLDICRRIWAFVGPVLCADAPEGLDLYTEAGNDAEAGGKERLSFCWRALKESSLLMNAMISCFTHTPMFWEDGPKRSIHRQLGDLTFQQLAELRHRGAFSTVSQTFASWCLSCTKSDDADIAALPKVFYQDALACFQQNSSALTRRSAGLPAMMTGILSAYHGGDSFNNIVLDLQAIADAPVEHVARNDGMQLPQVHAINCLKDIFTDTRFGLSSEPHMAGALHLAAMRLDCEVWAIRNCGLMLMKALLNRINGGTDTSSTRASDSQRRSSKLTYQKFPILPDLTLRLLGNNTWDHNHSHNTNGILHAQKVYPAIEIVERFGMPTKYGDEIEKAIIHHLEGPVWALRDKAAKALASIARKGDLFNHISRLLDKGWRSHNVLHGRLLHLRWLMRRFGLLLFTEMIYITNATLSLFDDAFEQIALSNPCPFTSAAYLDVVADLADYAAQANSDILTSFVCKHKVDLEFLQADFDQTARRRDLPLFETAVKRCQTAICLYLTAQAGVGDASSQLLRVTLPPETPQQHDMILSLRGRVVGAELAQNPNRSGTLGALIAWTRYLVIAGNERSDVSTRLAGVCSIRSFFEALKAHNIPPYAKAEMLYVYLALYDTLADDDEEARNEGAKVASFVLSTIQSKSINWETTLALSPPAAKAGLVLYLARDYGESPELWVQASLRLTGLISQLEVSARVPRPGADSLPAKEQPLLHRIKCLEDNSVARVYEEATKEQNFIFEEEKQNLYIDPIREADVWADILCQLEGKTFTNIDNGTVGFRDGVLGSFSKPDVFALIYRVIMCTKVIVHFQERGYCGGASGKAKSITLLSGVASAGRRAQLHDLLLDKMDEICKI